MTRDRTSVLSTPPAHVWPDGVLHHGVRVVMLLLLALLTTALFPPEPTLRMARFSVGMVADEEVQSRVAFDVPLGELELERARAEARASVPPTFNLRAEAGDSMAARLERFFDLLEGAATGDDPVRRIDAVLATVSIEPIPEQVALLADAATRTTLRRAALEATRDLLAGGVADATDLRDVTTERVIVREALGATELERSVPLSQVLSNREFLAQATALLAADAPPDLQDLLRLILIQHLEYSYELNVPVTELDRDRAARAVPTVQRSVLEGEAIVRANEQVTPGMLDVLEAYEGALRTRGLIEDEGVAPVAYVGAALINTLLLLVFGLLVFFYRREIYTNVRWVALMTALVGVYLGAAGLVGAGQWPVEAIPIAFVALAVAVLWDGRMALVLVLTLAVLTGVQRGFEGSYTILTILAGGAAASLSVRAVRRRAQTWIFIALISLAYALMIVGHALLVGREAGEVLTALGWAGANAIFSAIVAMGFLPVFEWLTGVTTDQTLLEWADPNRPLLRKLSMEAPGTYAHTINAANLAEAAANTIGANGLLCRVGMYYHDVGKTLKPHFFVENQPERRNPHDDLAPEASAAIVREHVVEGMQLARDAKLPEVVAAFIPEHHGTQRIGFFLQKAVELHGEGAVDEEAFAYPGPRPQSRETAIAMLADSVESATRALQEPTPERIRILIDSIVETKISERQLDEAPLTLRELAEIKDQFVKMLSGVYHHRIDYPQTRHLTERPE